MHVGTVSSCTKVVNKGAAAGAFFSNVDEWYLNSKRFWKILRKANTCTPGMGLRDKGMEDKAGKIAASGSNDMTTMA
eukprot:1161207-Pelagomonas_calceolata.AAC.6